MSNRMEEQYKTMDEAYRSEIKEVVKALDTQFNDRSVVWSDKATDRRNTEETFLEDRLTLRDEQQKGNG